MDALAFMSAVELAARIRDRSVSPREVVEASVRRIEAIDPQLGAFVELDAERALAEADAVEPGDQRPFAGVPVAVKANTPVAGLCMNFASAFLAGHRPTHSAYLVRRLREAGFVVVGTTNMPEFGILPTTEARHTGPARNPWDTGRTPGG
jgi:amidase